jgi:NitT/TauT family transport system permease protein
MTSNEGEIVVPGATVPVSVRGSVAKKRQLGGRRPSRFWRVREDIPARLRLVLMVVSILAPLVTWVLLRATNTVQEIFLPNPLDVLSAGKGLAEGGDLGADTWASGRRIALGFGIALLISIPLGLAMGTFKSINSLFEPLIGFVRYMPATAFVPLLLIWLGLDEGPKVALIVIGTVFFNTLMTANIVWSVPTELIRVSQTLGAGTFTVLRKVIFPYALPGMIDAARVNLAAAWNLIVVAELVAADQGLGFRIVRAQKFLHTDQIFAILVVIGLLGFASDLGLRALRNRVAPWSQE